MRIFSPGPLLAIILATGCSTSPSADVPDRDTAESVDLAIDTDPTAEDVHAHDSHEHDVPPVEDSGPDTAPVEDVADTSEDADSGHAHDADTDPDHPHDVADAADTDAHEHDADVDPDHSHDVPHDGGASTDGDADMIVYACEAGERALGECVDPVRTDVECGERALHIDEPDPIAYEAPLPLCGNHRPQWGKWGEYEYIPPQRWLHNMEHGGAAFLYDPCVPEAVVDQVRAYATALEPDDGGAYRWILTPYPNLPTPIAVVTWGHGLEMNCFDEESVTAFLSDTYRMGPEDVRSDGTYDRLWLNRGPDLPDPPVPDE